MSRSGILRLTSVPLRQRILSLSIRVTEIVGVAGHLETREAKEAPSGTDG